jgi:CheY-like chemotaxis protein
MLVADDDQHLEFLLKRAFSRLDAPPRPRFVRDGQETIDYLCGVAAFADREKYPLPKVLLLDLKMPKLNGFDVLFWVRRNPPLKRLICIIFSNSDAVPDINRAYDLGANGYVRKPDSLLQLYEIAEELHRYWCLSNLPPQCERPYRP